MKLDLSHSQHTIALKANSKRSNAKVTKNLGALLVLLIVLLILVVQKPCEITGGSTYLCVFANTHCSNQGQRWLAKANGRNGAPELLLLKRTARLETCQLRMLREARQHSF